MHSQRPPRLSTNSHRVPRSFHAIPQKPSFQLTSILTFVIEHLLIIIVTELEETGLDIQYIWDDLLLDFLHILRIENENIQDIVHDFADLLARVKVETSPQFAFEKLAMELGSDDEDEFKTELVTPELFEAMQTRSFNIDEAAFFFWMDNMDCVLESIRAFACTDVETKGVQAVGVGFKQDRRQVPLLNLDAHQELQITLDSALSLIVNFQKFWSGQIWCAP